MGIHFCVSIVCLLSAVSLFLEATAAPEDSKIIAIIGISLLQDHPEMAKIGSGRSLTEKWRHCKPENLENCWKILFDANKKLASEKAISTNLAELLAETLILVPNGYEDALDGVSKVDSKYGEFVADMRLNLDMRATEEALLRTKRTNQFWVDQRIAKMPRLVSEARPLLVLVFYTVLYKHLRGQLRENGSVKQWLDATIGVFRTQYMKERLKYGKLCSEIAWGDADFESDYMFYYGVAPQREKWTLDVGPALDQLEQLDGLIGYDKHTKTFQRD